MKRPQVPICVFLILLVGLSRPPAISQDSNVDSGYILYHFKGKLLRDSKWGPIADLQRALFGGLTDCGQAVIGVPDGLYGKVTQSGLMQLLSCPKFADLSVPANDPLHGAVHTALWQRLSPGDPLPTVHQRAFALSLTHEATDYDRVEWNYGTDDDKSALTWGPYGATVGWGNEVRSILKILHERDPQLLPRLFGSEFSTLERLIQSEVEDGYELLKLVHADVERRKVWKEKLQELGATDLGRTTYDWYAFDSDRWISPNLQRFYSLVDDAASNATEIDYAFFLDISMHASVSKSRIAAAKDAIAALGSELGRKLTPPERRRVIGQVWASKVKVRWRNDRIGRNVVFYIDGIGRSKLSEQEIMAWTKRSGRTAANFGLSDSRSYYPEFLGR